MALDAATNLVGVHLVGRCRGGRDGWAGGLIGYANRRYRRRWGRRACLGWGVVPADSGEHERSLRGWQQREDRINRLFQDVTTQPEQLVVVAAMRHALSLEPGVWDSARIKTSACSGGWMDEPKVELAAAIRSLRAELAQAMREGEGQGLRFRVQPVEMEFEVAVTTAGAGGVGVKFYVFSAEAKLDRSTTSTHRIKLSLAPVVTTADGTTQDAMVADEVTGRPK
jgi:hypothetical protein